jgi:hypothetical protein
LRIFIFGSCVSRDAFEFVQNDETLSGYIARSSFASGFSTEHFPFTIDELISDVVNQSKWQRRMMAFDLDKSASSMITSAAPSTDLIIVDFIDERFQLAMAGEALATVSSDFLQASKRLGLQIISNFGLVHFELWKKGFSRFLDLADSLKLPVLVNAVRLGGSDRTKQLIPDSKFRPLESFIIVLYEYAETTGRCKVFRNPREPFLDQNHKWGIAPFHFEKQYYEPLIEHIALIEKSFAPTLSKLNLKNSID